MTESPRDSREINPDKLVNRLLDILQQQQEELAKNRKQIDYLLQAGRSPRAEIISSERSLNPDENLRLEYPGSLIDKPDQLDEKGKGIRQVLGENLVFLSACAALVIIVVVIALRPPSSEISRLNAQINEAQDRVKAATIAREAAVKERNDQIVSLQKQLLDTQTALAANEKALAENVKALADERRETTKVEPPSQVAADSATRSSGNEEIGIRHSLEQLLQALRETDSAIEKNRESAAANASALASNNLELARDQLAIRILKGELSEAEAPKFEKRLSDFEPKYLTEIREIKGPQADKILADAGVEDGRLPESLEQLKSSVRVCTEALSLRQDDLKLLERISMQEQQEIVAVQAAIRNAQNLEKQLLASVPR